MGAIGGVCGDANLLLMDAGQGVRGHIDAAVDPPAAIWGQLKRARARAQPGLVDIRSERRPVNLYRQWFHGTGPGFVSVDTEQDSVLSPFQRPAYAGL